MDGLYFFARRYWPQLAGFALTVIGVWAMLVLPFSLSTRRGNFTPAMAFGAAGLGWAMLVFGFEPRGPKSGWAPPRPRIHWVGLGAFAIGVIVPFVIEGAPTAWSARDTEVVECVFAIMAVTAVWMVWARTRRTR